MPRNRYEDEDFQADMRADAYYAEQPYFGQEPLCPECHKPCTPIQCDDGIGSYEFWGQKSFDSRPYWGSDCCEAPLEEY